MTVDLEATLVIDMRRTIITALTMVLAVGMLAGFAGPVAADATADASVDQDQSNEQTAVNVAEVGSSGSDVTISQSNYQESSQSQEATTSADATDESITVGDITVDLDDDDDTGGPGGNNQQ